MPLPSQYQEASDEEDELDCLPQSDIDSSGSAQSDDYCVRRDVMPLSEVESASAGSQSVSRHSGLLPGFGIVGSDLSEPDYLGVGETDDESDRESDSDGELSNVNNLDFEDEDTCDSEVLLPPQLPFVAEEKLQEVWPLGDAAFAIFICPITHDVMTDPVVSADGYTYERAAIARWFETSRKSPVTGQLLPHADLVPNQSVRTLLKTIIDMTEKQQASQASEKSTERNSNFDSLGTNNLNKSSDQRKRRSISSAVSSPSDSSDSTHWLGSCESRRQVSDDETGNPKTETASAQLGQKTLQTVAIGSPRAQARRNATAGSASASSSSSSSSHSSGCQVRG